MTARIPVCSCYVNEFMFQRMGFSKKKDITVSAIDERISVFVTVNFYVTIHRENKIVI